MPKYVAKERAVEVAGEMFALIGTKEHAKFSILERRYLRILTELKTIEEIDYVRDQIKARWPDLAKKIGW